MAIHFTRDEFDRRRDAAVRALEGRGLAGILLFKQESMYYLTGYDTFGFCFFQSLWLGRDGRMALLTRAPDLRQAQHTSTIEDIRIWVDDAGADPAGALRDMVAAFGAAGARIGIERDTQGLTAANGRAVERAFGDFCALEDASDLVSALRLVKSGSELAHVRRAAALADDALAEAERLAAPGAFEGDILAAMQGAVFRGGGEYPGNPFILSSGPDALLCRDKAGRRRLGERDQLTIEFAGAYCRYHAALMRTLVIGPVSEAHAAMHRACSDALDACRDTLHPGRRFGEVFDAHARVLDRAGYRAHRLNACGYSLGATFAPTWMDGPMFYAGNPQTVEPGMVLFVHIILADSDSRRAMTLGETYGITDDGPDCLSRAPRNLTPGGWRGWTREELYTRGRPEARRSEISNNSDG